MACLDRGGTMLTIYICGWFVVCGYIDVCVCLLWLMAELVAAMKRTYFFSLFFSYILFFYSKRSSFTFSPWYQYWCSSFTLTLFCWWWCCLLFILMIYKGNINWQLALYLLFAGMPLFVSERLNVKKIVKEVTTKLV